MNTSSPARWFRFFFIAFGGFALFAGLTTPEARADAGREWIRALDAAPWGYRADHSMIVFKDKLWLIGGISMHDDGMAQTWSGDVWCTDDGLHWTMASTLPAALIVGGKLAVFQDQLWIFGGYHYQTIFASPDGIHWTRQGEVPWRVPVDLLDPSYSIATFQGKLWALADGGISSSEDGLHWTPVSNESLPPHADGYLLAFNDRLWVYGGTDRNNNPLKDAWSSADGLHWTKEADVVEWLPRYSPQILVHGQQIQVFGGRKGVSGYYTDAWSSDDGIHWTKNSWDAPIAISTRYAMASFKNQLWLTGGLFYDGYPNRVGLDEVWCYADLVGPPQIKPIAGNTFYEGASLSWQPELAWGLQPVTWSLLASAPDMTIDPATGQVTWPMPLVKDSPCTITVRAQNSLSHDDETWCVTIKPRDPPILNVPPFSSVGQCTINWTLDYYHGDLIQNYSGFTVQCARDNAFASLVSSAEVTTDTQSYTFNGLADGQTYWFRIRGNRSTLLASLWSPPASTIMDTVAPTGSVVINQGDAETTSGVVTLAIMANDGGASPSGVLRMRFSEDGIRWHEWENFATSRTWTFANRAGRIYMQVADQAGNISSPPATDDIHIVSQKLMVDCNNPPGPWDGSPEHPYRQIQSAINAANPACEVIVKPGTYHENLQIKNSIVLHSVNPLDPAVVAGTVIDGQRQGSVITYSGYETEDGQLSGLTIMNGKAISGAGINGHGARVAISHCRIINNDAYEFNSSSSTIPGINVIILSYSGQGGGLNDCDGLIENNMIAANDAGASVAKILSNDIHDPGRLRPQVSRYIVDRPIYVTYRNFSGGGLYGCDGLICNNTIWNNAVGDSLVNKQLKWAGAGLASCHGMIVNNIIWGDQRDSDKKLIPLLDDCTPPTYSCIRGMAGDGVGNFDADPLLTDPAHGDFHLRPDSPCIDAGTSVSLMVDFEGDARPFAGSVEHRGDGSRIDIGADEFVPRGAVWVSLLDSASAFSGGSELPVYWFSSLASSGTAIRLELCDATGQTVADLGKFWDPAGWQFAHVQLPAPAPGEGFRLRVVSLWNPQLTAETPPFAITVPRSAVPPGAWMVYE